MLLGIIFISKKGTDTLPKWGNQEPFTPSLQRDLPHKRSTLGLNQNKTLLRTDGLGDFSIKTFISLHMYITLVIDISLSNDADF